MTSSDIKVIDKAFEILNLFTKDCRSLSLKNLNEITSLNKSTLIRICNSLIKHNFLIKNDSGNYQLAAGCWKLGSLYSSHFKNQSKIKDILQVVCSDTGQSSSFWVREGETKVCLYRVNSTHELNHYIEEGSSFPLVSATGKMLLAYTNKNQDFLKQVEKKGYIFTSDERLENIASLALPIFNLNKDFCGTLSVSGFKEYFSEKKISEYFAILKSKQKLLQLILL